MLVLIVDDEPSIVNLVRMNLRMEGHDTICAYSGQEAIDAYTYQTPDIVLLDIGLPDMDGYDVLTQIRNLNESAAVIFMTADNKRTSKILALELGADDYITKPFDNKELVLRVKSLWRRINIVSIQNNKKNSHQSHNDNYLQICGAISIDESGHRIWVNKEEITLTYREFSVLSYMFHRQKRTVKRDELLEQIWGYDYMVGSRVVDILIKRLRDKLGSAGNQIKSVYGVGYKLIGEHE